ncbi:hypothetical protein D3C77_380840 [compost metagenome]
MTERSEGFYWKPLLPSYDNENGIAVSYFAARIFCVLGLILIYIREDLQGNENEVFIICINWRKQLWHIVDYRCACLWARIPAWRSGRYPAFDGVYLGLAIGFIYGMERTAQ